MFSKEEASAKREAFWTAFGKYMAPLPSADGERVNWVAYKTGEKGVSFRLEAEGSHAFIGIELAHPDAGVREIHFLQLSELRRMLERHTEEEWDWISEVRDTNGKTVARVGITQEGLSLFRQEDWPVLISFFKPRLLALDAFWSEARHAFEALR
jgi:hypothetical protein